jgi:hypothetical protein
VLIAMALIAWLFFATIIATACSVAAQGDQRRIGRRAARKDALDLAEHVAYRSSDAQPPDDDPDLYGTASDRRRWHIPSKPPSAPSPARGPRPSGSRAGALARTSLSLVVRDRRLS